MSLSNLAPGLMLALLTCWLSACATSLDGQPPPQNSKNDWAAGVFSSPVAPLGTDSADAGPK